MKAMLESIFTPRLLTFFFGLIAYFLLVVATDPSGPVIFKMMFGGSAILALKSIVIFAVASFVLHAMRRTLVTYFDFSETVKKCLENPVATGLVAIAVAIYCLAGAWVFNTIATLPGN